MDGRRALFLSNQLNRKLPIACLVSTHNQQHWQSHKGCNLQNLVSQHEGISEQWLYFFWASPASPSAEMCAYREFLFQLVDSAYIKTPYSLPDFGLVTKHESWVNTRISIGLSSLLWLRRQTFCWLFCTTWNLKSPSAAHVCRFAAATV